MRSLDSLKEKLGKKKNKKINTELFQKEIRENEEMNEKIKFREKKKRKRERGTNVDTGVRSSEEKMTKDGRNKNNKLKKKKRKHEIKNEDLIDKVDSLGTEGKNGLDEQHGQVIEQMIKTGEKIKKKLKKKRKHENKNEDEDGLKEQQHGGGAADHSLNKTQGESDNVKRQSGVIRGTETQKRKTKKSKKKKKEKSMSETDETMVEKREEAVDEEVYHIPSGEEDCTKGMKKWITEYHQRRPGLKVLQQKIDEFIVAHEEKLEQERKEREARAAEDGWTVVVHHKGRKKTTDSESGITVGSVAPVVAENQLAKKNGKEVGIDFYRFQKREAQRNEILALQNKFEQDRKRIQQLRAARKFKPY